MMGSILGRRRSAGFSLIELLASAAILGLLASVAVPFVETAVRRQKEQALRNALRDIRQGIDAYKLAAGGKGSGYPPSLTELSAGVPDPKKPGARLFFLRRIPRDPFSSDPQAAAINSWGLRSFDSSAEAPKKGDDVYDVYSTSTQTGLNGVPYKEW